MPCQQEPSRASLGLRSRGRACRSPVTSKALCLLLVVYELSKFGSLRRWTGGVKLWLTIVCVNGGDDGCDDVREWRQPCGRAPSLCAMKSMR